VTRRYNQAFESKLVVGQGHLVAPGQLSSLVRWTDCSTYRQARPGQDQRASIPGLCTIFVNLSKANRQVGPAAALRRGVEKCLWHHTKFHKRLNSQGVGLILGRLDLQLRQFRSDMSVAGRNAYRWMFGAPATEAAPASSESKPTSPPREQRPFSRGTSMAGSNDGEELTSLEKRVSDGVEASNSTSLPVCSMPPNGHTLDAKS
jgi:hypothetical protein